MQSLDWIVTSGGYAVPKLGAVTPDMLLCVAMYTRDHYSDM